MSTIRRAALLAAVLVFCASAGCSAASSSPAVVVGSLISTETPSTKCYESHTGPITFGIGTIQNTGTEPLTLGSVHAKDGTLSVLGAHLMSEWPGLVDTGHPTVGAVRGFPPEILNSDAELKTAWDQGGTLPGGTLAAKSSANLVVGVQRAGTSTTDSQIAGLTVDYVIRDNHFEVKIPDTLLVKGQGACT